jgi:4-carboxymuconolactone decarboxylase
MLSDGDKRHDEVQAREAELVGKPRRVEPLLAEDLSADLRHLAVSMRSAAGLAASGDIPEYSLVMLKRPDLLRCQFELGAALFRGEIPARERELAVLRIGWLLQSPFEWGEHVNIAKRCGLTSDEIERVTLGSAAPGWSEHDAAILVAVEELLAHQALSDNNWARLASYWTESQLIEFAMLVGQYVANAILLNMLRIRLSPDNPGLGHR